MADQSDRIKKEAIDTAQVVEDAFRNISSKIGEYFEEALSKGEDVSKNMVKDVQGSLNSLSRVSKDLASTFEKANQGLLKQKDYTREIQERNAKLAAIKAQIGIAERAGVGNAKALNVEYQKVLKYNKEYEEELKKQLKFSKNLNSSIGLTGTALSAASKIASKIGLSGMDDVFEEARDAAIEKAKALGVSEDKSLGLIGKIKTMGAGFKVVGKAILKNLTDPLFLAGLAIKGMKATFNFFASAYKEGEEASKRISDENVGIARSLGLAQGAANKLAGSVAGMGPTTAAAKQSITGIYEAMGSTEKLSSNTLRVFVKLNTQAGMSAESLAKFQKFAKLSGQDAGELVKNMSQTALETIKTNKYAFSQKNLLNDVANVSSTVALRFKDQPAALVKAVAKAKSLGIEMGKIEDIASSLLNFEDSIAAEMEAELLTGKQLNLEKAREAALRGDTAALQDEIISQLGSIEEFNKMNVIQQDAFAKSIGLSRGELAGMLDAQKKNESTGGDLVDQQQDGLKSMTSEVSEREAAENRARAAAESNIKVYKQLAPLIHELQNTWTEIKKTIMDALAENVLKPAMEFLQSKEGKDFLAKLPEYVKSAAEGIKDIITQITDFVKEHPTVSKWLAGGAIATGVAAKTGALGGLMGLLSGKSTMGEAAAKAAGVQLGEPSNPMYVKMDSTMDVGELIGSKGRASIGKQFSTLFKKPQTMFRAMAMKGKGFTRILGRIGMKFGSIGKTLTTFGSAIKGITGKLGSFTKSLGSKLLGGAKSMASKALGGAKSMAGKALSGAKGMASSAWSGAKSMGGKALSGAKSIGSKALSGIKNAAQFAASKGGNIAGWFKSNTKNILPKVLRSGKGALKGVFKKIPFVGGIIEAIDAGMDINELAKSQNMSKSEIFSQMGKRIIGGGLGVMLGSIAATLVSSLQAVGIPGWLMSTIAFAGGDWLGKKLGGAISDYVGGPALGKAVFNTFYSGKGADQADDFILQNGKMTKFRKDDLIIGGTKLDQGLKTDSKGGSLDNTQTMVILLEKIVHALEKGGTVVLDGQKVGDALVAGSYRMQ